MAKIEAAVNAHVPALNRNIFDLLDEYDEKAAAADEAVRAFNAATDAIRMASVVRGTYSHPVVEFRNTPDVRDIQRSLLVSAWRAAYNMIQIDRIASAKDKARFQRELENPPPFTFDNLKGVFGDYVARPRFHVLRGLAEVFADLDPAYKSHSKVRIGVKGLPKRVILSNYAGFGSYGLDKLRDIVRALAAYRGEQIPDPDEFNAVDALHCYLTPRAGEAMVRDLTVRVFANRNAHVIFDEASLLDINRALAEFYGDVLPDAEEEDAKPRASTALSKDLAYYPTPQPVIERVMRDVYFRDGDKVLEPSCGCGRFLDALAKKDVKATGVEVDPGRAAIARSKGHAVVTANFLEVPPSPEFDKVVMNPPFAGRHYLKHVRHALRFLKPGGVLVSILPATAWYDHGELKGRWTDLPVASFAESGTNVPTGYIVMGAPG